MEVMTHKYQKRDSKSEKRLQNKANIYDITVSKDEEFEDDLDIDSNKDILDDSIKNK